MYIDTKAIGELMLNEPHRILLAAADYLEQHGWGPYPSAIGGGPCITEALRNIAGEGAAHDAERMFARYVGMGAQNWNDEVCQSLKEATAMLRNAAALAD